MNIKTVENNKKNAKKKKKKIKKLLEKSKITKTNNASQEVLPSWFEKTIEKSEISKEEQKELDDLLKNFT